MGNGGEGGGVGDMESVFIAASAIVRTGSEGEEEGGNTQVDVALEERAVERESLVLAAFSADMQLVALVLWSKRLAFCSRYLAAMPDEPDDAESAPCP